MNSRYMNPRFMIAAASSGSGKTTLTCGLIRLLTRQGMNVRGFKCGPDYIDTMITTNVLGIPCRNLDSYFQKEKDMRLSLSCDEKNSISVIEGVMGYYDGLAGKSLDASSYDVAAKTHTPVILVVDAKGMSRSVIPLIKGFAQYVEDSQIKGVIFNRCSKGMYPLLKEMVEAELGIDVVGYMPVMSDVELPSRHLGLLLPNEIKDFQDRVDKVADMLAETIDVSKLLDIANGAPNIHVEDTLLQNAKDFKDITLAIARDEAFCFYYKDNLDLIEGMGAKLVYFSPLHDDRIPVGADGLILGGGYPETYACKLSQNTSMLQSIKDFIIAKEKPCLAECGGFLYLHRALVDLEGVEYPMANVIDGRAMYGGKLNSHFGYISVHDGDMEIKGHEFHYYDSDAKLGEEAEARKPLSTRRWNCMYKSHNLIAGFPHLYYPSNPEFIGKFLESCRKCK